MKIDEFITITDKERFYHCVEKEHGIKVLLCFVLVGSIDLAHKIKKSLYLNLKKRIF